MNELAKSPSARGDIEGFARGRARSAIATASHSGIGLAARDSPGGQALILRQRNGLRAASATAEGGNATQKQRLVDKIVAHFGEDLAGKTFALWGLAFKPDTDDMREAPSRVIMEALWARGATIRAYDPAAMDECRHLYGERNDLTLVTGRDEALQGADALVLATEWKAFRSVDYDALKAALRSPAIFDGRNVFDPDAARAAGFTYFGIGR